VLLFSYLAGPELLDEQFNRSCFVLFYYNARIVFIFVLMFKLGTFMGGVPPPCYERG